MNTRVRETVTRQRLGDILVDQGKVSRQELESVVASLPREHRELLGDLLVARGLITSEDLAQALALQNGYEYVCLRRVRIDPEMAGLLPERMARLNRLVPIELRGDKLVIAMADPSHSFVLDSIQIKTGRTVVPCIALEREILDALDELYSRRKEEVFKDILEDSGPEALEILDTSSEDDTDFDVDGVDDAPVVKLVNYYISESIRRRSSDLHIEPKENQVSVRLRIDGVLHPVQAHPKRLHNAVVSRIKIMAELNISERRLPQDGRFKVKISGNVIDFRVSVLPTVFGEKVVIRLLDSSNLVLDLEHLGLLPAQLELFTKAIAKPYGMVLVTGPTGSGKTTTLYTALQMIAEPSKNVITVEDPVEYRLEATSQVQARSAIGLTFAAALRAILRQDPDIVMIGEIRDLETAEIAVKASLTGHLVLSTLHTNDAASAVTRLADMGVPAYLVTSSLILVIAQRLCRRICNDCRTPVEATPELLEGLGYRHKDPGPITIHKGAGCENCLGTGYRGRVAVYEMLELKEDIRHAVLDGRPATELKELARRRGMLTMRESGIQRVLDGTTTVEEVLRVTFDDDETSASAAAPGAPPQAIELEKDSPPVHEL